MNMGSTELLQRRVRLERADSVSSDATVRHVDQLDTDTLEAFYECLEENRPVPESAVNLEAGEVIVFTEYYRVVSV
ncbi:hypothetical protein Htur_3302 [Haloterrigena turkmenica DSM 5511]|uniref:DUF7979 domain-containing protein n=1 Tax=Haloterrigena turkmenica (strain ATCC 51198 / DSM 5511 / JCM 9101 / NCIMB 13204 / VKM B-1734 / 4k) TaxID=543526 RepID=D2RPL4_HALTV|nr:hypothetical protein [Haloterrigena turkmenica]ADB62166.1 hypothetical protein Htur_3302 [Haloterrigena turkmenica DSM 5511]